MVKHALGEGLAPRVRAEVSSETEGLVHREVGLDDKHGCPSHLALLKHVTTATVQHTIDPSNCHLRTLYFHKVHGLHEARFSREDAGIEDPSCGWNDLSSPTVDGVCVQRHIVDVEPDCS